MRSFYTDTADIANFISKKDINGLITALKDSIKEIRWMAAGALGELRASEAVESLIDLLSDSDPDVRWKAAESLGSIGDPRATEALTHLLDDPDETTRLQALWALGKIRDRRATKPIVRCLSDSDQEIKTAAIWALGRLGDRSAIAALRERLLDRHPGIRAKAAESLAACRWKPGDPREKGVFAFAKRDWKEVSRYSRQLIDVLIWALDDEYFDVRLHAARHLGEARSRYAVEHLQKALDDPVEVVGYEAAAALAEIGDARSVRALVHALECNFLGTRKVAAGALERLGWKPRTLYQQALFLSAKDDWVGLVRLHRYGVASLTRELQERQAAERDEITRALKIIGSLAIEPLIRLLQNPDPDIRWRAASLLGHGRDRRAVEPLIAALKDADERVASAAALALGEIGDAAALDALVRAFGVGDVELRKCSIIALGRLRSSERSIAAVLAAADDEHPEIRLSAIQAMGLLKDARFLSMLISFFASPEPEVRMQAIRALRSYPQARTTDLFIQALNDPDAGIRREASEVLGRRRARAAVQPLIARFEDQDTEVRLSAAKALDAIGWKPANAKEQLAYLIAKEDWKEIRRLGLIKSPVSKTEDPKPLLIPEDANGGKPGAADKKEDNPDEDTGDDTGPRARKAPRVADDAVPGLDYFIKMLADPDAEPGQRLKAAETLGKLGDTRGVRPLMNALADPDPEIRWRAALSLGMLGDQRAFSALIVALDDPVFEVKRRAAESIAILRPAGAVRPLCDLTSSPDPGTRTLAIETLAEFEDDEAVRALLLVLEDAEPGVKSAALSALLKLVDYWRSRVPVLLRDEDPVIRRNTISTLKLLLGEERAISHLAPLLRSGSFSIRREVLAALEVSGWEPHHPEERATALLVHKRWDEVVALGKEATGTLIAALFDTDKEIQDGAVTILEQIGDGETVQSIRALLRRRKDLPVKGVYAAMKVISLINKEEDQATAPGERDDDSSPGS